MAKGTGRPTPEKNSAKQRISPADFLNEIKKRKLQPNQLMAYLRQIKIEDDGSSRVIRRTARRSPWAADETFEDIVQDIEIKGGRNDDVLYVISCRVYKDKKKGLRSLDIRKWVKPKGEKLFNLPTFRGIRVPFHVLPDLLARIEALYYRCEGIRRDVAKDQGIWKGVGARIEKRHRLRHERRQKQNG